MESVLRAFVLYIFLLVLLRLLGRRTLGQMTNFDLLLLLMISNMKPVMNGHDYSLVNAFLVAITLVATDVFINFLKDKYSVIGDAIDGRPLVLVAEGKIIEEHLKKARVDREDLLSAGRERMGISRIEHMKYAILERTGKITVIPMNTT